MGVKILGDYDTACMYCSTTDWAFGPIFTEDKGHDADERVHAFLDWLPEDPRHYSESELESKYNEWLVQEESQWTAKVKEETD
jgi:hypothetical protein